MIKEMKPLSLEEAREISTKNDGKDLEEYFKSFIKLKKKDVESLRKDLEALDNHKIRQEYIIKIIDFLPEDASDINKIFVDVSLDENETKQIIEIVKKYK